MTHYCRICGKITPKINLKKKEKKIIPLIVWQYWMLELDASSIHICKICPKYLYKHHVIDFSRRKDGRKPKYRISIIKWDSAKDCPIYGRNGLPLRYEIAPDRRLNGGFRNPTETRAEGEVEVTYVNIADHSLEEIDLSNGKRRSSRKKNRQKEKINTLHSKIKEDVHEGLKIIDCGKKIGRGIQTTKSFRKSTYVATYVGKLLNKSKAEAKELEYANLGEDMCYTHYFRWNDRIHCYDATIDDGSFGRLINHSRKRPNILPKVEVINGLPHIYFKAIDDISPGTELRYDYGDRKSPLEWLKF